MNPSSPQPTDSPHQPRDKDGRPIGVSSSWQSFASMSSNQLPSQAILESMDPSLDAEHESEHDKPSVLPEILPGFKSRMADIHHATLKSVAADSPNDQRSNDNGNDPSGPSDETHHNDGEKEKRKNKEPRWTGGTMFPSLMGWSNPIGINGDHDDKIHSNKTPHHRSASADANRKLARNSILYESSDLTESTTKLSDEDDNFDYNQAPHQRLSSGEAHPSKTLVQGGQGEHRWSHELSPDKAGLAGAALEAAGLLKDVVLDKIHQRYPSSASPTSHPDAQEALRRHMGLSPEEKLEAAKVAFSGAEETGDQNIYLEGLQEHLRHENAERSAAATAASSSTGTVEAKDLLGSAPEVAQEHRKSVFHLAANPEVRKAMLLEHPESLGYHSRDPNLAPFEEPTVLHHRLQGSNSEQDVSKTGR